MVASSFCHDTKSALRLCSHCTEQVFAPFQTLLRYSVNKNLMFCCRADIVPRRSQCEHKPYPSNNLQCSLSIWKDHLPVRGSIAISAPIKCSDLTWTVSKTYPIWNVPLSTAKRNKNSFESSVPSVNRSPIRYTFCNAPFHCPVQCHLSSVVDFSSEKYRIYDTSEDHPV